MRPSISRTATMSNEMKGLFISASQSGSNLEVVAQ